MKFAEANIIFLLMLTTCVQISYTTVPDTHSTYNSYLPLYVCSTFPFCAFNPVTRKWHSVLSVFSEDKSNQKISGKLQKVAGKLQEFQFNPRDSDDSFSKCTFEEEYCSTSGYIEKYESDDVDSPATCQQYCEADDDCNFWTFLTIRGKTTCSLLSECSAKTKCPNKLSCASGNLAR